MTIVIPRSFSFWKIPMISTLVRLSRLPVGSSARTTSGSLIKRARDRDALLLAAGKLARMMIFAAAQARPTASTWSAFSRNCCIRQAMLAVEQRQLDVFAAPKCARSRLKLWKTKPSLRLRMSAS